jgi:hypothetical protein
LKGVCDNALPAADLEVLLVRPSDSVLDAARAACDPVCRFGVPVCESALPPADFDLPLVLLLVNVFDAFLAAFGPVVRLFFMLLTPQMCCKRSQGAFVGKVDVTLSTPGVPLAHPLVGS